jgi:hypothetical protein
MSKGERGRQIAYASVTPDVRDMRDPQEIGRAILNAVEDTLPRQRASILADEWFAYLREIGVGTRLVLEADGRYVGPLERYGDPRARHKAVA